MINPTGYTALDLVGFTDKGTYASNVNYVKNDIVHYGGNLWRCKIDDTMNVTPAEGENWTVFVGEPTNLVERIIAPLEENPATVAYATGRQIIYDDWLWEVIDDIAVGDPLIDYAVDPTNANIKKATPVETQLLDVKKKVGNLVDLHTTNKDDLVAAVNEVKDDLDDLSEDVGDLSSLTTADKTSSVAATNEVNAKKADNSTLAIVETDDTCTHTGGISTGQYVCWKGALYTADSNISVGATFASSGGSKNLSAVTDGGLNKINSEIEILSSANTSDAFFNNNIGTGYAQAVKIGKMVVVTISCMETTLAFGTTDVIAFIPGGFKPKSVVGHATFASWDVTGNKQLTNMVANAYFNIDTDGRVRQSISSSIPVNSAFFTMFVYECA